MSSTAVAPSPSNNLESKILQAASEAGQIANEFAPGVGNLVNAGVAVEPIISGFIQMIIGLFKHHTGVAAK